MPGSPRSGTLDIPPFSADPTTDTAGSISANVEAGPSRLSAASPNNHTPPAARPRISKACAPCGRQKLKCEGGAPCARCVTLECAETCVYLPSLRGKTRKKRADREREATEKAAAAAAAALAADHEQAQPRAQCGSQADGSGVHAHMAIPASGVSMGPVDGVSLGLQHRSHSPERLQDLPLGDHDAPMIPTKKGSELTSEPHRRFWDRGHALAASGARNSALWRDQDDAHTLMHLQSGHVPSLGTATDAGWNRTRTQTNIVGSGVVRSRSRGSERSPELDTHRSKSAAIDKLTSTLPLPGDTHNPLAVLVELSEVTPPMSVAGDADDGSRDQRGDVSAPRRQSHDQSQSADGRGVSSERGVTWLESGTEDGYYAPLLRTLKDEAPHVMSLINTHE